MPSAIAHIADEERRRTEELRVRLVEARNEIAQLKHENARLRAHLRQRTGVLLWTIAGLLLAAAAIVLVK